MWCAALYYDYKQTFFSPLHVSCSYTSWFSDWFYTTADKEGPMDQQVRTDSGGLLRSKTNKNIEYMNIYCVYMQRELMDNMKHTLGLLKVWFLTGISKRCFLVFFLFLPSCETLMAVVHHSFRVSCRCRDKRHLTRVNDRSLQRKWRHMSWECSSRALKWRVMHLEEKKKASPLRLHP